MLGSDFQKAPEGVTVSREGILRGFILMFLRSRISMLEESNTNFPGSFLTSLWNKVENWKISCLSF